ncbi:MAG: hypothetical protein Q8R76_07720 [Candidatus Omnitrophota bacterium]|nr:hypothetical protein [Candidatus Omnitrophota bacterium]
MQRIKAGITFPSAAYGLSRKQVRYYQPIERIPQVGDVVYGEIAQIGEHSSLENKSARIHMIHTGSKGIFVFGNRYAPDYYEARIPTESVTEVDLVARSGIVGFVHSKNTQKKDPTRVKIMGYVHDEEGDLVNTKKHPVFQPKKDVKNFPRAKMILICGTAMNSGKSAAAASCCWVLSSLGYGVRGAKVTGTASLKDILHMNDAGADHYADFTYLGYPSTYLLEADELMSVFNKLDLKYANNPKNYWVVELADGINQRETAMLLNHKEVRKRIHKIIFCSYDSVGAIGGLRILKEKFNLMPDAISGVCSSSPLHIKELNEFTNIPIFNSFDASVNQLKKILL